MRRVISLYPFYEQIISVSLSSLKLLLTYPSYELWIIFKFLVIINITFPWSVFSKKRHMLFFNTRPKGIVASSSSKFNLYIPVLWTHYLYTIISIERYRCAIGCFSPRGRKWTPSQKLFFPQSLVRHRQVFCLFFIMAALMVCGDIESNPGPPPIPPLNYRKF